jgi:ubiquitin C-terminal hydrolase
MAGQYKSRVTCPDCKHHSTTFDPYITVTLPIPQKTETVTDVFFIFNNMNTKTKRSWFKYTKPDANEWVR